jgi:hypothetical protein
MHYLTMHVLPAIAPFISIAVVIIMLFGDRIPWPPSRWCRRD